MKCWIVFEHGRPIGNLGRKVKTFTIPTPTFMTAILHSHILPTVSLCLLSYFTSLRYTKYPPSFSVPPLLLLAESSSSSSLIFYLTTVIRAVAFCGVLFLPPNRNASVDAGLSHHKVKHLDDGQHAFKNSKINSICQICNTHWHPGTGSSWHQYHLLELKIGSLLYIRKLEWKTMQCDTHRRSSRCCRWAPGANAQCSFCVEIRSLEQSSLWKWWLMKCLSGWEGCRTARIWGQIRNFADILAILCETMQSAPIATHT